MKGAKKHFSRALTLLLSVLIMLQAVTVPTFAAENTTENVEVATNDASTEEESSFNLIKADVQIDDEYGNETDYISEVQIPDLEQISGETLVENGVSIHSDYPGDAMVYLTQRWLNQEYGDVPGFGYVTEDGGTGWDTVYGLTRALQVELGITSLADNFGPTTERLYSQNLLRRQDGVTNRKFAILQGALWCKGYNPGYNLSETEDGTVVFNGVFDADVEKAIIELKEDAGLINPDGVVTVNIMKALMSMDSFKLLSSYGGTEAVREMQQKLNRKYEAYTGITPCDGVYGRNTNQALIYALQAEEGMPTDVANANFGVTTRLCCPEIPYARNSSSARRYPGTSSGSYYSAAQITSITELLQFALLVNGHSAGAIDGEYGDATRQALYDFQEDMKITPTGYADKSTWLSLFISCGDTSRSALAADCATQLTSAKAKSLYDNGYRYIGRYLTGNSKKITRSEAQIIFDAGLSFFPIYQTSADENSYFTSAQGTKDANAAIAAAAELGIPKNTVIYFAVDYDCLDYQVTSNVIPYFKSVYEVMNNSNTYRTGIYGTRNVCTRVSDNGYADCSFVGDMSTGFSGNLGFSMPANWAFDQFYTTSIGSGSGHLEIDKDGFSGKDHGVSFLDEVSDSTANTPVVEPPESTSDKLTGPPINIFGKSYPLFSTDINVGIKNFKDLIHTKTNYSDRTIEITMGLKDARNDPSLKTKDYAEIKKMINAFKRKTTRATWNNFQKFRGNLKTVKLDFGFEFEGQIAGYVKTNMDTGELVEGGLIFFAEATASFKYPLIAPVLVIRLDIVGSANGIFGFEVVDTGVICPTGSLELSPALKIGADLGKADKFDVFAGFEGNFQIKVDISKEALEKKQYLNIKLNGDFFLDVNAFLYEFSHKWEFPSVQIYPQQDATSINSFSISKDDLSFIKPVDKSVSTCSSVAGVFEPNVQAYCAPQIISLGSGKMYMVFVDDAQNRTAENRTILKFSVFDGTQWSAPQPVLDDATGDFKPLLYPDGNGGAHIVWLNATRLFDTDVTLDTMASNTDIVYTHWNGSSFDNTYKVTDNDTCELNCRLAVSGDRLAIVWQQNSNNDPIASEGLNSIRRREFSNGTWGEEEIVASDIGVINSIETTYVNNENVVAYAASDTDSTLLDDLEIYYFGSSGTSRLTNNNVADYCPIFLGDKLYWINEGQLLTVDSATTKVAVSNMPSSMSNIKSVEEPGGRKAIIWTQTDSTDMKFYISYYNEITDSFTAPIAISNGDDIIRSWDACLLSSGEVELAYCSGQKSSDSSSIYGQLDLIQASGQTFTDITVSPVSFYTEDVYPGATITLLTDVYNVGSERVEQFDVSIIDNSNTVVQTLTVDADLNSGGHTQLKIPFDLPNTLVLSDYTIQVVPHEKNDVSLEDNVSAFTVGFADLAIKSIEEQRADDGRKLSITITNQGFETIDTATLTLFKDNTNGPVLLTKEIQSLGTGEDVVLTYDIPDNEFGTSSDPIVYCAELTSDAADADYINNSMETRVYPDYSIALTANTGGSVQGAGRYPRGTTTTIHAIPDEGYIFDGWYENGRKLDAVPQVFAIEVLANRSIEARFKKNDLRIEDVEIFGTLQTDNLITFTPSAVGGDQPYQWIFSVYKDSECCYTENTTVPFFEWTADIAGNYTVVICVSDATGFKASLVRQFVVAQ